MMMMMMMMMMMKALTHRLKLKSKKISSQTSDAQSQASTPEVPPARTPTENEQPDPFLFQEGKLFEMTRGGAIDMSRRSVEEEQDGFVFFPISEDTSEDVISEQVRESDTELRASLELSSESADSPHGACGPSHEPRESERERDLGFESTVADIYIATSTVTHSINSEQESSDSSAEDDQHSVIEINTPTKDDLTPSSGETQLRSTHGSLSSPKHPDAEPGKPKSKIPVKVSSFEQCVEKGDSTEQNQRPKSETEPISGMSSSGTLHSAKPQHTPEGDETSPAEKDICPQAVLSGDSRSVLFRPPSIGEDLFETRANWEDCVETQMQRLSFSSNPDQAKVDWNDDTDRKEEILSIVADLLGFSWTELGKELEFSDSEVEQVRVLKPNSLQEQSAALLHRWTEREGKHASEDCLIKKLTKINRMDIVHLIKSQLSKSAQEQTSRTYAEIERTLDHSEALSSVQEVSPRMVRIVDVSQKPPAAVSEEDLSVASLLDIPSWAEPVGHAHSESIHGDMLEELEVIQDTWGSNSTHTPPTATVLSAEAQEADHSHPEPEEFLTALEPHKPYFFNFSQSSIDSFSHELKAHPAEGLRYLPQEHAEEPQRSPPDDLSPVYEKSDMEESEKSSSEYLQSRLSGSESSKVLQLNESDQGTGEECPHSVEQTMRRSAPADWTQKTPDLIRTPSESDYVFVNPDSDQLDGGDPDGFDSACDYEGNVEKQESTEGWNEVPQIPEEEMDAVHTEESSQMIISYEQPGAASPEESDQRHVSEELCSDQHFSPQEQSLQEIHSIYTEDAEMQCEVQFEELISDYSLPKESILQRDVSPFSHSDVSPQTPDTVRASQQFEFGEVLWSPERTTYKESDQVLPDIPQTTMSQSLTHHQSESLMSDSPFQFSEEASFSHSFSDFDHTTVRSLSTDEALALLQKLVSTEHPLTDECIITETTQSERSGNYDDEVLTIPDSKSEAPAIIKMQEDHAQVLQSSRHLHEDQQTCLSHPDQNSAWETYVSIKPQEDVAESLMGGDEKGGSVQDCAEAELIQEASNDSEEEDMSEPNKTCLQYYVCSSDAPLHENVMDGGDDYDDGDDYTRRVDGESDGPQIEAEEMYFEELRTLNITQVSQKGVVRRYASAEDRTEGHVHSGAVKRAVVKSDGDETQVTFTGQFEAAVVRATPDTHLDTQNVTGNDEVTQGKDEEGDEFSEVHFTKGCRMEDAGL